jgi:hypothetical protein
MLIYADSVHRRSYIFVFDDLQLSCAAVRARTTPIAAGCTQQLHVGLVTQVQPTYLQKRVDQPCDTVDELTDLLQQQLCMYPQDSFMIMQPLGVSNPLSQGVRARIKLHSARC